MDLSKLLSKYSVWIDTCTWMNPRAESFFTYHLSSTLATVQRPILISRVVTQEIRQNQNHEDPKVRQAAQRAQIWMRKLMKQSLLQIIDSGAQDLTKKQFYLRQFQTQNQPICYITQNRQLAKDLDRLQREIPITKRKHIMLTIDPNGQLVPWTDERLSRKKVPLGTKVAIDNKIPIPVRSHPSLYQSVQSVKYGTLKLTSVLGTGGEGSTYLTPNGKVCKIYLPEQLTENRYQKIRMMLDNPIRMPGICWPKDLVTNQYGEFVGFVMEQAHGKHMQSAFFVKSMLQKNFPHWTREDLITLAIQILQKIKYLHDRNIMIGDIQPRNFLIENELSVYFVDTDSYQIGNYPCPVGTIAFTAPEIQGRHYGKFLRSWKHEYFSIATLIFMILFPGRAPYEQEGEGTMAQFIKKRMFPYSLHTDQLSDLPDDGWGKIWSHLPFEIREAFYYVFRFQRRLSPVHWIQILKKYKHLIASGYYTSELFPNNFQKERPADAEARRNSWIQGMMDIS